MYEKAALCSLQEYSSVARQSVPLKFDKLCFLQEFYLQVNKGGSGWGWGGGGFWNSLISKNLAHYSLSLKFLLIL